jgi:hypothetical protein
MAALTLTPDSFSLVLFDRDELVAVIARVADRVGFPPERELVVAVEEATPLQRVTVRGLDPVTIDVEGGAFEDPKRPRRLSVETTETVMAMVLHRIKDRLDGSFADAPPDSSLTQAQMATAPGSPRSSSASATPSGTSTPSPTWPTPSSTASGPPTRCAGPTSRRSRPRRPAERGRLSVGGRVRRGRAR